jgi:hypothetical protein
VGRHNGHGSEHDEKAPACHRGFVVHVCMFSRVDTHTFIRWLRRDRNTGICCGEPLLYVVAESARGVEITRRNGRSPACRKCRTSRRCATAFEWNRGTPFRIYRCTYCSREQYEGVLWPYCVGAMIRTAELIREELAAQDYDSTRWHLAV